MHNPEKSTSPAAVAVFDNYWGTTLTFALSLGRRGIPLHFYGRGAGRWSRYCTHHFDCPPVEDAVRFLPWLREKIRCGDITRIAPTTDMIAFYTSQLREEFSPSVRRTIAPLAEVEACLIKTRFAEICAVDGQATLATLAPDSPHLARAAAASLGFPVILKPKSHLVVGFTERGHLVNNADELARLYRPYSVTQGQEELARTYPELKWPLIQRYVASARHRVYSVSGIKDADDGILAASLSCKRDQWPKDVGVSIVQVSCENARILQAGLKVVDKLLSCGIFELELLAEGDNLYAIDLNPRAFGFLALDIARGFDLPWLWYRTTQERIERVASARPGPSIEARHTLLHFLRRTSRSAVRRARDAKDRRDALRPRIAVSMMGSWRDPLPLLLSHLHLLRHPRSLFRASFRSTTAVREPTHA